MDENHQHLFFVNEQVIAAQPSADCLLKGLFAQITNIGWFERELKVTRIHHSPSRPEMQCFCVIRFVEVLEKSKKTNLLISESQHTQHRF